MRSLVERSLFLLASAALVLAWLLLWEHRSTTATANGIFAARFLATMMVGLILVLVTTGLNIRYDFLKSKVQSLGQIANEFSLRSALVVVPAVLAVGAHQVLQARASDAVASRIVLVGAGLLFSLYLFIVWDTARAMRGMLHGTGSLARRPHITWPELVPLLIVILTGAAIRAVNLSFPMKCDESTMAVEYATSLLEPWLNYGAPNNHIIHSFLVYLSTTLIGTGELAVRLPAFGFSVAAIPATYVVGRRLLGHAGGLVASIPIAVSLWLIRFGYQARGYSATVCLSLMATLFFWDWLRRDSLVSRRLYLLTTIVLLAVVPTMAYFFLGLLAVTAIVTIGRLRTQTNSLVIWKGHIIVVVWTALIYFNPILNRVVRGLSPYPSEWGRNSFRDLASEYVSRTFDSPGADASNIFLRFLLMAGIALALLFVVGKLLSPRESLSSRARSEARTNSGQDREHIQPDKLLLATLVVVPTLLPVALLALQGFALSLPYARNFLYLAPFAWLAALWGWQSLFVLLIRRLKIDSRLGTNFYRKVSLLGGVFLGILVLIIYLPAVQGEWGALDSRSTDSEAWMSKELATYLQLTLPADASVKVAGGCIEPRFSYYLRDSEVLAQFDRDYDCEMDAGGSSVIFIPTGDMSLEHFSQCNPDLERVELIFASEALDAWRYEPAKQSR